jgi:hypothetical protein
MQKTLSNRARAPTHVSRVSVAYPILVMLAIFTALTACHGSGKKTSEDGPIAECVAYADLAGPCFGERAAKNLRASFAVPPTDATTRETLRQRCTSQTASLRRVCR